MKKFISLFCSLVILLTIFVPFLTFADDSSQYVYTFNVKVNNPCKSGGTTTKDVCDFYFDFNYTDKNGYGSSKNYRFDMSRSNGSNRNNDFLYTNFIRKNNNSYNTSFDITIPGKITKMYVKLNMDHGERLSIDFNSIYCNGQRINNNTDYVSSAYYDSKANIYCSMDKSAISEENSPYFKAHEGLEFSEKEIKKLVNETSNDYNGQFKDQFNAVLDTSILDKCVSSSDGAINQYYSHHDEESMYKYTLYFRIENAINLNDADHDEVETFYIRFNYIDENGYGSSKTYDLDMAYNKSLKRNNNPNYLSHFERYSDSGYTTHFDVWVPGIVTSIKMKLNMSGEKLCTDLEKVTLNSIMVNTTRDYVSSVYFDSNATIKCSVPNSQINIEQSKLPESDYSNLTDQYGSLVSKNLFEKAKNDPQRYLYHQ